jgi:Na+/H+ antiporter NhaD/arsenite permease-like protein
MIVISANSGGAWSPIGDVTTTMLCISACAGIALAYYKISFYVNL